MIAPEYYFLAVLALIWIIAAVIQDLRKREVANWLNFSLIAIAFAYRAFLSVFFQDYRYFMYGLAGFGVFFALANSFYYGRIFAGGDAKLLMALGAVLPFSVLFYKSLETLLYFILLMMFAGSFYGLLYSIILSYKSRKKFVKEVSRQIHENKKIFNLSIVLAVLILIFVFFMQEFMLIWLSLIVFVFPFLYSYAKAVEESCMIKKIAVKNLTVGDWLYKEVRVGRKIIKPNWEGLNEQELALLKKTKKKVFVKQGIPFTPAFLIAFVVLILMLAKNFSFVF